MSLSSKVSQDSPLLSILALQRPGSRGGGGGLSAGGPSSLTCYRPPQSWGGARGALRLFQSHLRCLKFPLSFRSAFDMVLWNFPRLVGLGLAFALSGSSRKGCSRRWSLFPELALPMAASSRLLCSAFQPRGPHSALNSPTVPNFVNKRPYIFQCSVSFPNPMVTIPSSPQKILLPSRLLGGCSRVCTLRVNSNTPVVWQNHPEVYRSQHIQVTGGWSEGVVFVPQEWANASHWF